MPSNRVDIKNAANVEVLRGVNKLRQALDELGRIESLKRLRLDVMLSRRAWEEATALMAEYLRQAEALHKTFKAMHAACWTCVPPTRGAGK